MELVMKGVGPEEIAEAVGVTKRTVQGRLAAGGVAIGDREMEGMRVDFDRMVDAGRMAMVVELMEVVHWHLKRVREQEDATQALRYTVAARSANAMIDELLKRRVGVGEGGVDKRMMRQVADAWNAYLEAGQKEGKTVVEMEAEAAKTELSGKDGGGIEPEVNDAESVT